MDAKTQARIFEPFFTTKPVGKGTGLGLAVVHGIIQSHEGVINVESQPGEGTSFLLYFPAQTVAAAATDTKTRKLHHGRGQRILLVDDEPALTGVFKQLLRRLNYEAIASNSAAEALGWFREKPTAFDLVITDLTMPEMNGLEIAREVRTLRPDMPVVLATGYTSTLNHQHLLDAGICELLEKPVSMTALADVLERVFGKP
jgi:CheY-like chemotaxis protein